MRIKRSISLFIRKIQSKKSEQRLLNTFKEWKEEIKSLPEFQLQKKKLLIIRLDDIGDYILFGNTLELYKTCDRWRNHEIVFLGNIVFRELFDLFHNTLADKAIWLNKAEYFRNAEYRKNIWATLRLEGFETVICPSRTRPLLLDDLCAIATGAPELIGSKNSSWHSSWNKLSDSFFTSLFQPASFFIHELFFNKEFAEWCCGAEIKKNFIIPLEKKPSEKYVICFIGSSTKSKTWPAENWVELINSFQNNYPHKIIIAGGKADAPIASGILIHLSAKNNVENLTGKTSLIEMMHYINNASLVISNDTMAAHMAVVSNTPVIIIANGNNAYRFTDYKFLGRGNVFTLYPAFFLSQSKSKTDKEMQFYTAVTKDIATIQPSEILQTIDI